MKRQNDSFNLREKVKLRLVKDMIGDTVKKIKAAGPAAGFILVLDDRGMSVINSCAKMVDLFEEGILAVERLSLSRKPFPKYHAIYFVEPSSENINKIAQDFVSKDKKLPPLYFKAHLFFPSRADGSVMEAIKSSPSLLAHLENLKEINIDFECVEDKSFTFNMQNSLTNLYAKGWDSYHGRNEINQISMKLGSVIAAIGFKKVEIVYSKTPTANSKVSERVANLTKDRLEHLYGSVSKNESASSLVRLVILERNIDPVTPLIHDFRYQPMVRDLLGVKGTVVEFSTETSSGKQNKMKAELNEKDSIWVRYRHMHIAEVAGAISDEFKEFMSNHGAAKMQMGGGEDLNMQQLSDIVKSLPQYTGLVNQFTLHMQLADKVLELFRSGNKKDLCDLEQTLATGVDSQGKTPPKDKLLDNLTRKMDKESPITKSDQARLLLIAFMTYDFSENKRKKLLEPISIDVKQVLHKLIWLGINPNKPASQKLKSSAQQKEEKQIARARIKEVAYDLCRTTPQIERLITFLQGSTVIDPKQFETMMVPSGSNSSSPNVSKEAFKIQSLRKANQAIGIPSVKTEDSPKLVVCMLGGMSYTEIAALQTMEASNKLSGFELITGGTSLVTPVEFLNSINHLPVPEFK